MAHKGNVYPIRQEWRVYGGEIGRPYAPPQAIKLRAQFWVATFAGVPNNAFHQCDPLPWSPGDVELGYQSGNVSTGTHDVRIGAVMKMVDFGVPLWRYAVWDNSVDQIPWGWHDQPDHYAWHPGNLELIFTFPAAGGSIYPVGQVELVAKPW